MEKALRYNQGKPDYTLIDFQSLLPMVDVLTYGMVKYTTKENTGRENWKKTCENPKQHLESMFRHWMALCDGESLDKESGLPHIGHIMCNAMFYSYHTNIKYNREDIEKRALLAKK